MNFSTMTNYLLQQVRIINPVTDTDKIADVLIANGKISQVQDHIHEGYHDTHVKDCQGLILGTGLVDLYSHSGQPGFEERETISSLLQSAKNGGFTRIGILPDTNPPLDHSLVFPHLSFSDFPHLYFWGSLTQGVKGEIMTELMELATTNIVGFSDGKPINNLLLLKRVLEYLQPINKPVSLYPCSRELCANGVMREGVESVIFGLPGIPTMAETSALAAILEIVEEIKTSVHIMRVSTARTVELIADAKARNLPITASTTWLHLILNSQNVGTYDPSLKLDPPLGNPHDQLALIEGIKTGIIDAIAIDHTPYTYEEKTVAFGEAPWGAIGLELALPLLWRNLVETGQISALQLWKCLSQKPAECLQQKPSNIAPEHPAEVILFNPNLSWNVNKENIKSLSENTHLWGEKIIGKVINFW
jgi:dihydroorotase